MDLKERRAAYKICKQRGHEPSGITLASNPPWSVCKHCKTAYQFRTTMHEMSPPGEETSLSPQEMNVILGSPK